MRNTLTALSAIELIALAPASWVDQLNPASYSIPSQANGDILSMQGFTDYGPDAPSN